MYPDPEDTQRRYNEQPPSKRYSHYYGDIVRKLFLFGGFLILVSVPTMPDVLPLGSLIAVIVIILLTLLAGITNPRQIWVAYTNTFVSAIALIVFEYYALVGYQETQSVTDVLFLSRQALAVVFFFAFYFASKTVRGIVLAR